MGVRFSRLALSVSLGIGVFIGSLVGGSVLAEAGHKIKLHGQLSETAAGAELGYDISGRAKMTVKPESTKVKIGVRGLRAGVTYTAHLHNGTCASGGGGHYQNVEGGAVTPPNELWLSSRRQEPGQIVPRRDGKKVRARGSAPWAARIGANDATNAESIVIHDGDGTRIACGDLN